MPHLPPHPARRRVCVHWRATEADSAATAAPAGLKPRPPSEPSVQRHRKPWCCAGAFHTISTPGHISQTSIGLAPAKHGGEGIRGGHVTVNVVEWLLESDPWIRWQVMQDVTDAPAEAVVSERSRVGREGRGARLLGLQDDDGQWGGEEYSQAWTCTTYTLLLLRHLGLEPASREATSAAPAPHPTSGVVRPSICCSASGVRTADGRSRTLTKERSTSTWTLAPVSLVDGTRSAPCACCVGTTGRSCEDPRRAAVLAHGTRHRPQSST
jgi:hypothetical protein